MTAHAESYRIVTMPLTFRSIVARFSWQATACVGDHTVILGTGRCRTRKTGIRRARAAVFDFAHTIKTDEQIAADTHIVDYEFPL